MSTAVHTSIVIHASMAVYASLITYSGVAVQVCISVHLGFITDPGIVVEDGVIAQPPTEITRGDVVARNITGGPDSVEGFAVFGDGCLIGEFVVLHGGPSFASWLIDYRGGVFFPSPLPDSGFSWVSSYDGSFKKINPVDEYPQGLVALPAQASWAVMRRPVRL